MPTLLERNQVLFADNVVRRSAVVIGLLLSLVIQRGIWAQPSVVPSPAAKQRERALVLDVRHPDLTLEVDPRRSLLIRTRRAVTRYSITRPDILEIAQYSPTEFELIGGSNGQTALTLWFDGGGGPAEVLRYLVTVQQPYTEPNYGELEDKINELFPNSWVQLIPIADKLIVRGQARDSEEAAQILAIIRGQAIDQSGDLLGPGNLVSVGAAAPPPGALEDGLPASQVISLLDVMGQQQVMLKVRIAEMTRTALRELGADLQIATGDFALDSLFTTGLPFRAVLDSDEVLLALEAIASNAYSKVLAEPNLVTLNGRPASFIAGGEFAVPTVVGVQGAAAVATTFRGFGTQVVFTPTIIDRDRIRLFVAPSLSALNEGNSVDGIPGLDTRAVSTTVDLREGQWLAIAGLIQDQQGATEARVPLIGDIPILSAIFSNKEIRREETELIILVSPELIEPMGAHEVPLVLPGMQVTEPGDWSFYLDGRIEGRLGCDHRSTIYPVYRDRVLDAHHDAMKATKLHHGYQLSEDYYVEGPHGFSQ